MVDWMLISNMPNMDIGTRMIIIIFAGMSAIGIGTGIISLFVSLLYKATDEFTKKANSDQIGLFGTGVIIVFIGLWIIFPSLLTIAGHAILGLP